MSDVMLHGVLNMPPNLWCDSPIDIAQRHSHYKQASQRIDQLERELAEMTKQRDHYKTACDQYSEDETLNMLAEARKQRDNLATAANRYTIEHAKRGAVTTETIEQLEKALAAIKGGSDE